MQPSVGTTRGLMKLLLKKWLITENKSFHFTTIKLAAIKQAISICLSVLYKDEQVVVPHTSAWNVPDCVRGT